jgi:hypothetical protein
MDPVLVFAVSASISLPLVSVLFFTLRNLNSANVLCQFFTVGWLSSSLIVLNADTKFVLKKKHPKMHIDTAEQKL